MPARPRTRPANRVRPRGWRRVTSPHREGTPRPAHPASSTHQSLEIEVHEPGIGEDARQLPALGAQPL